MIATRWHQLHDAVRDKRIKILAPSAQYDEALIDADTSRFNIDVLEEMVDYMSGLPRFVVDPAVIELVTTDQAMMSIGDMATCNVLQLPFQTCVVEFAAGQATYNILLREIQTPSNQTNWLCSIVAYKLGVERLGYAVVSPCMIRLTLKEELDDLKDTLDLAPAQADIQYSVYAEQFVTVSPSDVEHLLNDAYPLSFHRCFVAYLAAMLLPQTVGLRREAETIKQSFNKSRLAKGRSPIPNYTSIRLGSYRTTDGATKALGRGTGVEVHLRRAHKRRIAFGPGRSERVWRFFPAQVVGYLPDGRKPSLPEMLATRATKPYFLK